MKSTVTKLTRMEKKDSYGNTSFIVEFQNGDSGFYTSKDENQDKFVVGKEVEYNIEEKTGKTGKTYFKLSLPQAQRPQFGGRPQADPKVQMISFAMSYCKDCIVAGKIPISDMEKEFNRIYNIMTSKL